MQMRGNASSDSEIYHHSRSISFDIQAEREIHHEPTGKHQFDKNKVGIVVMGTLSVLL